MSTAAAKTEIQMLIDTYRQAVSAKDVDTIMSFYDESIVAFDAIQALQFVGKAAYHQHWQACMQMCPGPHMFEFQAPTITACEDVAFAHWLAQCGGTNEQGEMQSCWMRASAGYRRINGQWRIVHEHWSAPFDPASGAALFDLKP